MKWITTSTKFNPNWRMTSTFGNVIIAYTIKK